MLSGQFDSSQSLTSSLNCSVLINTSKWMNLINGYFTLINQGVFLSATLGGGLGGNDVGKPKSGFLVLFKE